MARLGAGAGPCPHLSPPWVWFLTHPALEPALPHQGVPPAPGVLLGHSAFLWGGA